MYPIMGISNKIDASTLITLLIISIITTILVLQYGPEDYQNPNMMNLMENETLSFVEGVDTNNDSKFEYISFGLEFMMIEDGNYTLELTCSLGHYETEITIGSRMLSFDDDLGYQNKGIIQREYLILTSYFGEMNLVNFTMVKMLLLNPGGYYDVVKWPLNLGFKVFELNQIDSDDPYEVVKMELNFFNDTDSEGFENGEFNFTAFFRFAIALELEFGMDIRSYNTSESYSYTEELTLNITDSQIYTYYYGLNFSTCGKQFTYVSSIYYYFNLEFSYEISMEYISETIYY
jgi:hypothetical protein